MPLLKQIANTKKSNTPLFSQAIRPEMIKDILTKFGVEHYTQIDLVGCGAGFNSHPIPVIQIDGQNYLLKELKYSLSDNQAMHCVQYANFMRKHGIPIPALCQSQNGDSLIIHQKRYFILEKQVIGREVYPHQATPNIYKNIGKLLAQLHSLSDLFQAQSATIRYIHNLDAQPIAEVADRVQELRVFQTKLGPYRNFIMSQLDEIMTLDTSLLKKYHIHSDINLGNLFFNADDTISAVFDWELTLYHERVIDFLKTLFISGRQSIGYQIPKNAIESVFKPLFHGYNKNATHKLTQAEVSQFSLVSKVWFLNRIHKYVTEGNLPKAKTRIEFLQKLNVLYDSEKWLEFIKTFP